MIWFTYLKKLQNIHDNHLFHLFAYFINIFATIIFFKIVKFDSLIFWIYMLFEALFLFSSYNKLKKLKW